MILSRAGRWAVLLALLAAASASALEPAPRRGVRGLVNQPGHRALQDCGSASSNGACGKIAGCAWQGSGRSGSCVSVSTPAPQTSQPTKAPTPGPSPPPTNQPTTPPPTTAQPSKNPTGIPTSSPIMAGMGYCSDGGGQCSATADCACASGRRARRRLQTCTASRKNLCNAISGCAWINKECVSTGPTGPPPSPSPPTDPPPTTSPTKRPTGSPTSRPTTGQPSGSPTGAPSQAPVVCECLGLGPTKAPTPPPTAAPSPQPSSPPSTPPTLQSTRSPSAEPTAAPTEPPTSPPSRAPTMPPTPAPSNSPSTSPSKDPTASPTSQPTNAPSKAATPEPTPGPSNSPSANPSGAPTGKPTHQPSDAPSKAPTPEPTPNPSASPSKAPTGLPTRQPSNAPSKSPTSPPSPSPVTDAPTSSPTSGPTRSPVNAPTNLLQNHDFENGLTGWTQNAGTIQIDTTEVHSGSQSLYVSDRTNTWNGPLQDMTGVLQPNHMYRVSCWAKLGNQLAADTDTLKLTVQIDDDDGRKWPGLQTTIGRSWTKVEGDITVAVTGTLSNVLFFVEGPAAGEDFWVDDCSIEFLSTLPPTLSPTTAMPSGPPTPGPTKAPSTSDYGNGPFVTVATSSELVTIPRPPAPESFTPSNCPHLEAGLLSWHDPATWGGSLPSAGQSFSLPENSKVVIAQAIANEFGVITVPSTSELIFDDSGAAITLDVAGMDVQGALRAGSSSCPYESNLTITLHGSRPTDLDQYGKSNTAVVTYKGISVDSGTISMHGKKHYPTWSRLAESVAVGQTYLLTQEQVDWSVGQEVLVTTTAVHDSREHHQNEVLTIASIVDNPVAGVGSAVHFTTAFEHAHIANTGYQAEVGLLSRNIKVQGAADDSEPTDPDTTGGCGTPYYHHGSIYKPCERKYTTGFGGHIMVHNGGKGYVEGVELFRMGQTNVLGRYPFHWHQLGNDCADCYFRSNSIHRSFYRCISIHGTHNTLVSENVAFDVNGYCYYLEDGVEENNEISYNLAAHIHPVSNIIADMDGGQTIPVVSQSKDLILPADATASGYYLTNLNNIIVGNAASGGWSGFALPVLRRPIGANQGLNMRPGNRLTKTFDGNTAHSTGWWWSHAGAFYSGGSLYYSSSDPTLLEYNAGRDQSMGGRSPCLVDKCVTESNCEAYCFPGEMAWYHLTNSKVFLTPSSGLNSWSGRMKVVGFETHDVALGLESLESGFGISDLLVDCRSGEEWSMLVPGASPADVSANGFFWYDTGQEHIITSATFRNCGVRMASNEYDTSPTRGCDTSSSFNGCGSRSTVWGFLTHSDQFTPEIMQATKGIAYEDCGRRFTLYDYAEDELSSVSGRNQNWLDTDGSASGLGEPVIIGSGLADAGQWWQADDSVVYDPEGPLKFIQINNGPQRGLAHFRLWWKDSIHNTVGSSSCFNGYKGAPANPACPAIGRVRHLGSRFANDPTGGLPVTANAEVAGLAGGFGWLLQLDDGPPKNLRVDQIEVDSSTPLMLVIPYPSGTSFEITARAAYCSEYGSRKCTEQFGVANSISEVRNSNGNVYFFDAASQLLYVRIIQMPQDYTGDPDWHLWTVNDPHTQSSIKPFALDRFTFDGITLPTFSYGPYLEIQADCVEGVSGYCASNPTFVEPEVCPSGYEQVSYDQCCVSGTNDCLLTSNPTAAPTTPPPTQSPSLPPPTKSPTPPTPPPTFGSCSNMVLNPGFEDGLTSWYANGAYAGMTITADTSEKQSGNQSILASGRTETWMGPQQTMTGRLEPWGSYRLSCWAKAKTPGTSTQLGLTLRISDDAASDHWNGIWPRATITDSAWTLMEGTVTVDVTGTLNDVWLYADGAAVGIEYWLDSCSIVPSGCP